MPDITDRIIQEIKRNRISTTEVADCMDKTGAVRGVTALNRGFHKVGRIFWAYAYNESNWEFHEQIRNPPEESILFCETYNFGERAVFGALVSKFLILYRQLTAIVVDGYLRDAPHLMKENWPIWMRGLTPIGGFNRRNETPLDPDLVARKRDHYDNAVAVCDDCGVVVIPKPLLNESFLEKLDFIEKQEDTWFDCIDRLKWDTFETVCLKKYKDGRSCETPVK